MEIFYPKEEMCYTEKRSVLLRNAPHRVCKCQRRMDEEGTHGKLKFNKDH